MRLFTLLVLIISAVTTWAGAQQYESFTRPLVLRDFIVIWDPNAGATISYRGVPVFVANASEFVMHRAWQEVFYRSGGRPRVTVTTGEQQAEMLITDRSERFDFSKRLVLRSDGSFRVEYQYQALEPERAELQVLFGLDRRWLDGAAYSVLANGQRREGRFAVPTEGRIDPWSGATEQVFTSDLGTLTITATRPVNLLCTPERASLWWSQALVRGESYTQVIEVSIKPGPALGRGLVLSGLRWPHPVRNGQATFAVDLARTAEGPRRVRVQVRPSGVAGSDSGEPVELALSEAPVTATCSFPVADRGWSEFELLVADADTGAQLLQLAPLAVLSAPLLRAFFDLSLYTDETQAQVVVELAEDVAPEGLTVQLSGEGMPAQTRAVTARRITVPVDLAALPAGSHQVSCRLLREGELLMQVPLTLHKAPPKRGTVKIDNISHSLIVDGLPLVPFGFYTYFPLAEGVMDEEVVRGFNLFSPYHGGPHDEERFARIRAYLDRCAQIGMWVNYHLMWSNRDEMTPERWAALRAEIEAVRDHPALLSWYIADEPGLDRVEHLEGVYRLLKELDPYHPVTIVFCQGPEHARRFANATDVIMVDPYPIPLGPVTRVSETADSTNEAFDYSRMLWMVPQCFGGNEWWQREPTAAEQRVMTYLSLIHGARAIQYFIRSPRISFPKSPIMWAECGALALETAELTPALTSHEPAPRVSVSPQAVHACALRDRGIITILAANTENRPLMVRLQVEGIDYSGQAEVLFENRTVQVTAGAIEEPIDAFGTRAYALPVGPVPPEDLSVGPANLTVNPSWEDNPNVGTPEGCYANVPAGATIFVDARVARHGRHSLRITAPAPDAAPYIRPFPLQLKAGQEYRVSIWGKARDAGVALKLSLGSLGAKRWELDPQWREYSFTVKPTEDVRRAQATIGLDSAGTAWLDLFQVVPAG